MKLTYNLNAVHAHIAEAAVRKNQCPCCDPKTVGNQPTILERWRKQARSNTREFLEEQFGKKLEKFDNNDWRIARRRCPEFLSPVKTRALERPTNSTGFIAGLTALESNHGLVKMTAEESEKYILDTYGIPVTELKPHQTAKILKNAALIRVLDTRFVAQYLIPTRAKTMETMLRELSPTASLAECNRVLLALPLRGETPKFNGVTGLVELPPEVWKRIRLNFGATTLPLTMQTSYAGELGLLPKSKLPKSRNRVQHEPVAPAPRAVVLPPKPVAAKPRPAPAKAPHGKTDPNAHDAEAMPDMSEDDLDDIFGEKKTPMVRVANPTGVMHGDEIIRFINRKANEALLPGDFPRGVMTPVASWSNTDWAMVHKYRSNIDPKWSAQYQDRIDSSIRAFKRVTGETTASIGLHSDFGSMLLDVTRELEMA